MSNCSSDKICASDLIRSILWTVVNPTLSLEQKIYMDNSTIVHICGLASKQNENIRKMFTHFKIFFNLDNMPINSRRFDEIMACMVILGHNWQGERGRVYKADDTQICMQVIEYLSKNKFIFVFSKMINILSYYNEESCREKKSGFYPESIPEIFFTNDVTKTA